MKKLLLGIICALSITGFAQAQDKLSDENSSCVEFKWSEDTSPEYLNLFCGKEGTKVFSKASFLNLKEAEIEQELEGLKSELNLEELDVVQLPGKHGYKVYSKGQNMKTPVETIVVLTRDRLRTWSFSKDVIGYNHSISSTYNKESEIKDDIYNSNLQTYLTSENFVQVVSAKTRYKTIKVYVRY
jgi:hypothetical protein